MGKLPPISGNIGSCGSGICGNGNVCASCIIMGRARSAIVVVIAAVAPVASAIRITKSMSRAGSSGIF